MRRANRRGAAHQVLRVAVTIGMVAIGAAVAGAESCATFGCGASGSAGCGKCAGGCRGNCPDDYCPKPIPCFCLPPTCGGCDDYCPKPQPCFCLPPTCGCCDDYCPKPEPCVKKPCGWPIFYKCPPPLRCAPCGPMGHSSSQPDGSPCK